jgi:hypothetical protein
VRDEVLKGYPNKFQGVSLLFYIKIQASFVPTTKKRKNDNAFQWWP